MKTNQRGFTHNVALMVLGVFVFATVGFAGFRVYQNKNSDSASAANYRPLYNVSGQTIGVCDAKWKDAGWALSYRVYNGSPYTMSIKVSAVDAYGGASYTHQIASKQTRYLTAYNMDRRAKNPYITFYINGYRATAINFSNTFAC